MPEGPELVSRTYEIDQSARTSIDLYFYNINSNREFVLTVTHEMVAKGVSQCEFFMTQRSSTTNV